jgi:hypothetical protein
MFAPQAAEAKNAHDPSNPLVFPHNFNRVSDPDSNFRSGCHNEPFVSGGGDRVGHKHQPCKQIYT